MDEQTQVLSLALSELETAYATLFLENCRLKNDNRLYKETTDEQFQEVSELSLRNFELGHQVETLKKQVNDLRTRLWDTHEEKAELFDALKNACKQLHDLRKAKLSGF